MAVRAGRGGEGGAARRARPAELAASGAGSTCRRWRSDDGGGEPADGGPADRGLRRPASRWPSRGRRGRSTGWPSRRRTWWRTRWRTAIRGWRRRSTGRRRSATAHYLWDLGLGVAEAMDTAQRGMGLGWPEAQELIGRALDGGEGAAGGADRQRGGDGPPGAGAGGDGRRRDPRLRGADRGGRGLGGRIILMASRALAAAATGPDDYVRVYDRMLSQVREPVIIHWLGRDVRPGAGGLLGVGGPLAGDGDLPRRDRGPCRTRSTGSRSRCSRRRRRSPCAGGCRRGCGCIPGTTSTMPS